MIYYLQQEILSYSEKENPEKESPMLVPPQAICVGGDTNTEIEGSRKCFFSVPSASLRESIFQIGWSYHRWRKLTTQTQASLSSHSNY